jgi:hypothetical protein
MAGNSDTNGNLLFFTQPPPNEVVVETKSTTTSLGTLSGLYSCNIMTDVMGESVKVQVANVIYYHIELKGITSIDISGSSIILHNVDELPISLTFISASEAQSALALFEDAIDGQFINCSGTILNSNLSLTPYVSGSTFSYPCLVFANNVAIGKATNQSDVINLLNVFGQFNYITVAGGNNYSFTIEYTLQYQSFVPTSISYLNTFFTCGVNSNTVSCSVDYPTGAKFWTIANSQVSVGNTTTKITFPMPANNSFDVFYVNNFLNLLDLSNNNITYITGTLPYNIQTLNLIGTNLSNVSFLSQLTGLKNLLLSQTTSLTIDFTENTQLVFINLTNCVITTITGTSSLVNLITFEAININIPATPDLSAAGTNLQVITCTQCNFISSLTSIASNTSLTAYIINGSILSVSSIDLTHNTKLRSLIISNTSLLSTFPSLIDTPLLSYIDASSNDLLNSAVEGIIQNLVSYSLIRSGTLNLSNQTTPIDYALLPDPFTANLNYLRNQLGWTVNL